MHGWIKFPSHQFSGPKALGPADQRLFQAAVERHVEYGISYAEQLDAEGDGKQSRWRPAGQPERPTKNVWGLAPSLHLLGGLRRYVARRRSATSDRDHHHHSSGQSSPPPRNENYFTLKSVTSTSSFSSQNAPIVLAMNDDVKQVLVACTQIDSTTARKLTAGKPARAQGRQKLM